MSEDPGITMEEAELAEGNGLLGGDEVSHRDRDVAEDIDEAPEDLMTDMKLEDEIDELRLTDPDFQWSYHIEIYPWNADDMTENFVRLLKLADFTQIFMKKKRACRETREQEESVGDKLQDRQRKGSIHLYTDSFQNAKLIIRSSTWKAMVSKQLTFEITRREPQSGVVESAYLEVDTYTACKCRYRDKPKGEFKDRTAKVSCIPGTMSREFLDVVLCRAIPVIGGSSVKEYYQERDEKLHQKLSQIKDFDGYIKSLDFDCLSRGSCRAFVTAHKNVYLDGQRISIVANSKETMNAALIAQRQLPNPGVPELALNSEMDTKSQLQFGGGTVTNPGMLRGNLYSHVSHSGRGGMLRETTGLAVSGRGRGLGRSTLLPQRPASNTFTRSGPGMPVPMTGRQKMNEKMRRSNPSQPLSNNMFSSQGGPLVPRGAMNASLGESFKQEIASLQKQLQQNTAELEAKIAMLRESTNPGSLYCENDGEWDETAFGEKEDLSEESFASFGGEDYSNPELSTNYHLGLAEDLVNQRGIGTSDSRALPGLNVQSKSTDSRAEPQRGIQPGSSAVTQEMVAGQSVVPHGDFVQMSTSFADGTPISQLAIMSMLQTRPGQILQHIMGQLPQAGSGQVPQMLPGQIPQTISGQIHQTMAGQMPQIVPGQLTQTMLGQTPQPSPAQLAQALLEQMAQVLPADLPQQNHRPIFKPTPGQVGQPSSRHIPLSGQIHTHRGGGGRGGGSPFQRMRGGFRGRGKQMSGSGGW
ncbi:fibrillin 1 [Elysia marginata]|uniref:Fibrillin 1 n=1 Tax=Elysia marginata TaxID=1093978 RepID=A0AAV4J0E8_9GAST|nr:fibrillin 1 [Elysia marginata]